MKPFMTTCALSLFALTMFAMPSQQDQAGCLKGDKCCKKACCPKCSHDCQTCKLEAEIVDVEKKCFEVECKTICIPRVVFPWQKKKLGCHSCDSCEGRGCTNCVHNGAKVRKVKVLKSKKYKCPECEYTWTPEEGSPCCGTSCDRGGECGCCDLGCDSGMLLSVPEPSVTYDSADQGQGSVYDPMSSYGDDASFAPVEVQPMH